MLWTALYPVFVLILHLFEKRYHYQSLWSLEFLDSPYDTTNAYGEKGVYGMCLFFSYLEHFALVGFGYQAGSRFLFYSPCAVSFCRTHILSFVLIYGAQGVFLCPRPGCIWKELLQSTQAGCRVILSTINRAEL